MVVCDEQNYVFVQYQIPNNNVTKKKYEMNNKSLPSSMVYIFRSIIQSLGSFWVVVVVVTTTITILNVFDGNGKKIEKNHKQKETEKKKQIK